MTNRETIVWLLRTSSQGSTCADICKYFSFYTLNHQLTQKQLNATVSSELKKMVDDDILEYTDKVGIRGGRIYSLKTKTNKIIASRDIIVVEAEINDEVIQQLKKDNDTNLDLRTIIDSMKKSLTQEGVEVFDRGNDFVVCEKGIYIACYEDEFDEKFTE